MQFLTNVFVTHQRFAVTVHWKRSERKPKLLNTMGCYCFAVVLFLLVVFVVLFTLDCNFVWEFCQIILSEPYVEISSEQLSMAFPHSTSSLTFPQWFLKRSSNLCLNVDGPLSYVCSREIIHCLSSSLFSRRSMGRMKSSKFYLHYWLEGLQVLTKSQLSHLCWLLCPPVSLLVYFP